MTDRIIIFDTTLRDGEQSPGASMTLEEKVRIALQLEKLGVDIIEAGFAAASPGDFKAIEAVAKKVKNSTIAALARANEKDITAAGQAIAQAKKSRIHTFIATSTIHLQYKLKMSEDEVLEQAVKSVKYARQFTDDVEFSPEDAGRSDINFLVRIIEAVITAGATTINMPDTVGYNVPAQYGAMFKEVISRVPNSDRAIFSCHCHNDLGLAVANSLSAVENGVRQVECTINGLGERAGNTSLEEVVMALKTRQDVYNLDVKINTEELLNASKLVSNVTGFIVQPNKAIVGANAFAHEAGIHQDGVLKNPETYEIMNAVDIGWSKNSLVLGKHSGRGAIKDKLLNLGFEFDDEKINSIFIKFKDLADKKHEIYDEDLFFLASDLKDKEDKYQLASSSVSYLKGADPKAELEILIDKNLHKVSCSGYGLVDASFKAIEQLVKSEALLILYSVKGVTDGTDSLGETSVRLEKDGRMVNGQGSDLDIIKASVKAYLNALNRLEKMQKINPQKIHGV